MLATREQVGAYVEEMKAACGNRCRLRYRTKNIQALEDLGWKQSQVRDTILDLRIEDYSHGPMRDKRGLDEILWLFGPYVDGQQLYVKVAVWDWGLKVHSFHRAEKPLRLPLK